MSVPPNEVAITKRTVLPATLPVNGTGSGVGPWQLSESSVSLCASSQLNASALPIMSVSIF